MRLVLISLFLSPLLATAQSTNFECKGQKPLKNGANLVERVQSAYTQVSALSAKFVQNSYLAALETSEVSSGEVIFAKPGQMRWHYSGPDEQDFVVKQETVWFYQKSDNQVLIDDFRDVLISDLPVSFLMGIGDMQRDFKLEQACQNGEGIVLRMSPRQSDPAKQELESFRLLVNAQSFLPLGAMVNDVSGNRTTIILSEMQLNPQIEARAFDTEFGSGADLIDRRSEKKRG